MICSKCGYEWDSRVGKPVQCPRCKRYDWNVKKEEDSNDPNNT